MTNLLTPAGANPAPTTRPSDAILERLTRLHPKAIDLSLERIERLLARLRHPERRLPPVVHVAGTNGKGSLIAYLHAMLEAAGNRVHVYTSPHLIRFHERIRLNGHPIDEALLTVLLEECEAGNGGVPITFFEITTAAAFLAFAREPADVLLLETGLGGRLDATNVIDRPLLSVITPVSIDHVQFLGPTLEGIAFEKSGILKRDVAAVIAAQPPTALEAIERRAAEIGSPLYRAQKDWRFEADGDGFRFMGRTWARRYPAPALAGAHQLENAALAVACAEHLTDFGFDDPAIFRGLREAVWPGRLQCLRNGRLARLLPATWELWLDGGHNAAAGEALGKIAAGWQDRALHLVFGMMNSKAPIDFLAPLARYVQSVHAVAIPDEANSFSAEQACALAAEAGLVATPSANVADALAHILARFPAPARVLICGSLYLAGRVLAQND